MRIVVGRAFSIAMTIACAALVVAACGLYGEEESKDDPNQTPDGAVAAETSTTDATAPNNDNDVTPINDAGACQGAFGAPTLVPGLQSIESEYSARFTQDELTVYITRPEIPVAGLSQTWAATRPSRDAAFKEITRLAELGATTESIAFASVPTSQLSIFFQVRTQADAAAYAFQATRALVSVPFGPRKQLPFAHEGELAAPYVTPSGDALWINFNEPGARKIVRLPLNEQPPNLVGREHPELGDDVGNPVVTNDELEIFFYRPTGVHHARRTSISDGFGVATLVRNGVIGLPSWISPDGCRLYVCIDNPDANTKSDVFVLTRSEF